MNKSIKIIISVFCMIVVIGVIITTFLCRDEIEKYAATGYVGVFLACVASTTTILLPAPGILVVIRYSELLNPFTVILLGGLGTALGELLGYILGRSGKEIINIDKKKKIFQLYLKKPYLSVFLFALIPLPIFDIVGICAGITKVNSIKFVGVCMIGKTIKMAIYVMLFNYTKEWLMYL